MAERAEDRPERAARKERRDEDAEAREEADRPLAPRKLAEIDLQRAGEEQEREHAVEKRPVELHAGDRLLHVALGADVELAERRERERERK